MARVRPALSLRRAQLRHVRGAELRVERRRRIAVAAARAVAGRDLAVDPRGAPVERGEEPRRHARLEDRALERQEVVVRAREQVVRVRRVDRDRRLVVRADRVVAAEVDVRGRVSGGRAREVRQRAASDAAASGEPEQMRERSGQMAVLVAFDRALVRDRHRRDDQAHGRGERDRRPVGALHLLPLPS